MKTTAYLAFALLGVIWGSNFIFLKWAAEHISPGQIVLLRVAFGFLPIVVYALAKRALRWEHLRYAHHFAVMSLLATAVYYFAFAKGTVLLPSSIAGLLSGAIPLFTFVCAWLFRSEEHITMTKAAGVGLGFVGVLLIARPWSSVGAMSGLGVTYMIAGSMSVGCSFVYARRFITPLKLPAVALVTYQIGLAMMFLSMVTSFQGIGAVFTDTRAWIGLIVGLGLFGTGLAYVMYYFIVEHLGAVAAAGVTYIPPVVALVIGVFLLGDTIHPIGYAAMILILSGVAVLQLGGRQGVSSEVSLGTSSPAQARPRTEAIRDSHDGGRQGARMAADDACELRCAARPERRTSRRQSRRSHGQSSAAQRSAWRHRPDQLSNECRLASADEDDACD